MAAVNFKQMYLSSNGMYTKTNECVQSYYAKNIVSNYVEIHNKNCNISKMAANMAAKYLNLVYLCSAIRCKEKCSVVQIRKYTRVWLCRNYYKQLHVFQDGNKDGHQKFESNVVNCSFVQYKVN